MNHRVLSASCPDMSDFLIASDRFPFPTDLWTKSLADLSIDEEKCLMVDMMDERV